MTIEATALPDTPFTRVEAAEWGISGYQLGGLCAQHQVRRVLRNVYVRTDVTDSVELRATAAGLVVSPGAVFVDRTAAWLHGVDVYDYREREILPPLDCVVLRDRSRIVRPELVGGERDLAPYDLTEVFGLRVTTPLRTALDLACRLPRPDGLAALDELMRRFDIPRAQLLGQLPRYRRRRGVVKARELATIADPLAESPRESRTRLAIHDAGLPLPTLQHWVEDHGRPVYRLDLAYPRHRVAVEYDGEEWHDRTEAQRAADRRRRQWLVERGWTVIVVRRGDFDAERRHRWLGELRAALGLD